MTKTKRTATSCRKGCIYSGSVGGMDCCNYCLITGIRRPCPAGQGCTEYKRGQRLHVKCEE